MDYKQYTKKFMDSIMDIQASRVLDSIGRFSKGETRLLAALYFNGGRMQAKELAHIAGISTARVTAILNVEEEKNYIRREAIDGDRRKINVILTETGALEYQNRCQKIQNRMVSYFEFLGEEDTNHLFHIMDRTKEFMQARRKENQEE